MVIALNISPVATRHDHPGISYLGALASGPVKNPCLSCPLQGLCGDECGRNPSNSFRV